MSQFTKFARPYAQAAFEYAVEHNKVAAWSKMLQALSEIVQQPLVTRLLDDPNYSHHTFAEIIIDLCSSLDEHGKNFIKLVAEADRLKALPEIAHLYEQHRATVEKTIDVQVLSVIPLDDAICQRIKTLLEKKLMRQVNLDCAIDPNLLGGMVVKWGDQVIDASLRAQLTRLQEQLLVQ